MHQLMPQTCVRPSSEALGGGGKQAQLTTAAQGEDVFVHHDERRHGPLWIGERQTVLAPLGFPGGDVDADQLSRIAESVVVLPTRTPCVIFGWASMFFQTVVALGLSPFWKRGCPVNRLDANRPLPCPYAKAERRHVGRSRFSLESSKAQPHSNVTPTTPSTKKQMNCCRPASTAGTGGA